MSDFLAACPFEEDFLHHESSYRVAAIIHYLHALGGDRNSLGTWMLAEGHNWPPVAAAEYFNEHYYRK